MNKEAEMKKMIKEMEAKGITFGDFMKQDISDDLSKFKSFIEWSNEDYKEYSILLDRAINISGKRESEDKTKEVGDVLEDLVKFIIERTYFFDVIKNIRTRTNEIDLYIYRSKEGEQALEKYKISEKLLIIPQKIFIGECKNYDKNIGSTWFGKFYAVMKTADCDFGILFSLKRATGNFENWSDSYGLIRTLTLIEKYENKKEFYLLDFGLEDFKAINPECSFFDIIERKMIALKTGTNYDSLVKKLQKDMNLDQKQYSVAKEIKEFNINK